MHKPQVSFNNHEASTLRDSIGADFEHIMDALWEIDEMFVKELDPVLFGNEEYETAKEEFVEEIKIEIEPLKEIKRRSTEKKKKVSKTVEPVNIYELTVDEILERIRCKCRRFKAQFSTSADADAVSTTASSVVGGEKEGTEGREGRKERKKEELTMSLKVVQTKCFEFQNVKEVAIKFIDNLLTDAEDQLMAQRTPFFSDDQDDLYAEGFIDLDLIRGKQPSGDIISSDISTTQSLGLPLIREFTPKAGRDLILDAVRTWNLKKKWSYCIKFIQENSDTCSDYYVYEVIWSLPTMSYPIPQATASVFFTIEVSRVTPNVCPVKVKYNFETERLKFSLEDDIQHEKFLNNILKCKISFFKTIRM